MLINALEIYTYGIGIIIFMYLVYFVYENYIK